MESIYLTAEDDAPLADAKAGQYLTLRAAEAGEPPPVRSYSLSSTPEADTYRISVKCESHGIVSSYLHTHMQPGSVLDVAAPRGDFVLDDGPDPVILMSAGVGITPVLAMLHQLAATESDRSVWWIHTTRDAGEHAFVDETRRLLDALPNAHEQVFYTAANAVAPQGTHVSIGRPSLAALADLGLPVEATAYICGPASFMQDVGDALQQLGLAAAHLRTEVFGALPAINPGIVGSRPREPHQPPGPPGIGPSRDVRTQRPHRGLVGRPALVARAGRRLRRPDAMVLPHRGVPHLHHADPVRRRLLPPPPAGDAGPPGRPHLLFATGDRRRGGPLTRSPAARQR